MSYSEIIGPNGKILKTYVDDSAFAVPTLGAVLTAGNSAETAFGAIKQSIVDVATLDAAEIVAPFGTIQALESGLITDFDATGLGITTSIGSLRIKGAISKGSMLVGDGTKTETLVVPSGPALPDGSVLILDSTTALGMRWGGESGDINSITPGANIDITGPTANPIVALQSPLTSTLALGSVNMTAGTPAAANSTTNASGVTYQSGGVAGGPITASYLNSSAFVADLGGGGGGQSLSLTGLGITNINATVGTSIVRSDMTPVKFSVINGNAITSETSTTELGPTNLTHTATAGVANPLTISSNRDVTITADDINLNPTGQVLVNGVPLSSGGVASITAGANIGVNNAVPSAPEVSLLSPLTSTLNIGQQNMTGASGADALTINSGSVVLNDATATMTITKTGTENLALDSTGPVLVGRIDTAVSPGSAQTFIAVNNSAVSGGGLRTTLDVGNGCLIEYENLGGPARPMNIKAPNAMNLTGGTNFGSTAPSMTFKSIGQLNTNNPQFIFEANTNTNGSYPLTRVLRSGKNADALETLHAYGVWAPDQNGTTREWTRIQTATENVSTGNQDGTLSLWGSINGVVAQVANFNGAQNENNMFRPLDMNGNALRTTTGSLSIDTNSSTTAGAVLTLATKDATAGSGLGLALTGNTLLSGSAGGNSGQHLCLSIGGTVFKIALLNA